MRTWLAVAAFGALGAVARYGMDLGVTKLLPGRFPWAILLVNVLGSFAIGLLYVLFVDVRPEIAPWIRGGLAIGFLGAFTTFSTFSLATVRMLEAGELGLAAGYIVASLSAGLAAAWAGLVAGRALWA